MKYVIDTEVCEQKGVTLPELFVSLILKIGGNIDEVIATLKFRGYIEEVNGKLYITKDWNLVLCNILFSSDKSIPEEDVLEDLARKMTEIFPKGKKEGTNVYWRGNIKDTTVRLQKFFKYYKNKYTQEDILKATELYVKSFNGNYSYMRTLKYFIWKFIKVGEEDEAHIEENSDLASIIENMGQEDINSEWTTTLK